MFRIRTHPCALVAGCALPFLTGCQSSPHSADERYFLLATNIKISYWQAAAAGLSRAATDLKIKAEMAGPDTYDPKAQKAEFARIAALKPAGIMVSVADPELLQPDIDAAVSAGIPVVTIDSDAPASQRLMFIGTNNYQAGLTGGRVLARQLQGKGNVIVFTLSAQANLAERLRGYQDAIASSPNISIVQTVDIRGNPALAFDKTVEIIESGKVKAEAFVCLEATACKEVAEVLSRKKMLGKTIVAMDTDEETLGWIENGGIAATIAQRPYTMAYYGLRVLDDLHHHSPKPLAGNWSQNLSSPIPSVIDTGATLIDRANVAQMRDLGKDPAPAR